MLKNLKALAMAAVAATMILLASNGAPAQARSAPAPKPDASPVSGSLSPDLIASMKAKAMAHARKSGSGSRAKASSVTYDEYCDFDWERLIPFTPTYMGVKMWQLAPETFMSAMPTGWDDERCQIGKSFLTMQKDGNLVLYDERGIYDPRYARWSSGTSGHPGAFAYFQRDGNFVLYTAEGVPIKKALPSNTYGSNLILCIQADGNIVIYSGGHNVEWQTKTYH